MFLLFAAACLGHLVLMVLSHNWFYGLPLPRWMSDLIHLLHGLLVAIFPALLWWAAGPFLSSLFLFDSFGNAALTVYVVLCWFAAFVLLPADLLRRRLRKPPPALGKEESEIVDIVKQLGGPPAGVGRNGLQARLPFNEALTVEYLERTLHLPRLPAAWDGLSILHLSDLHLCGTPDRAWFRAVMDRCAAWAPDLIAVTGDMADGVAYIRWIAPVLGKLRCKTAAFAILGNHDAWYAPDKVRRRLRRIGMRLVGNSWEQIDLRGEPLVVIGQEAPWFRPGPDLSACPAAPFRLCLSHTPDNIRWAQRAGVDLMLAGHVHGGQVRLPLVGAILVPSRYGRRYDCGVFDEPPTVMHVSRGLGGDHPLRFRCRPEATRLILRRPCDPAKS
ncbi:MAG TPA: metallophosphoesterase [Gemmataceae bacterium]|nr:metallophosphoesterase [Gemmataceae bacterium]